MKDHTAPAWRGQAIPVDESDVRPEDCLPESDQVMAAWRELAASLAE